MDSRGTNRELTANGPDIIIKPKRKEISCILIDVTIPADRNYAHKEAERKVIRVYV
jgi:hypothetical protein